MTSKPRTTGWKKEFDNKPTIEVPRIQFSLKFSKVHSLNTKRVIEIGCGIGSNLYLVDRNGNVGVDLQLSALEVAKKYCKKTDFIAASASYLPFKPNVFDLIYIWGLIEELPIGTEIQAIIEAHRIMADHGKLLLSAYNKTILSTILDPGVVLRMLRRYAFNDLQQLLVEAGFSIKEYTIKGGWYTMLDNNFLLFYKHVLHKKDGRIKKYFELKSDKEFKSSKFGKLYTFIMAEKK